LDQGAQVDGDSRKVLMHPAAFGGGGFAPLAMPGLREVAIGRFDDGRGQTEVGEAAGLADLEVEHDHQHRLVRCGNLQHLRPRMPKARSTIGRQLSVSASSSSFTTESTTFCSISVSARLGAVVRPPPPSMRSTIANA